MGILAITSSISAIKRTAAQLSRRSYGSLLAINKIQVINVINTSIKSSYKNKRINRYKPEKPSSFLKISKNILARCN